MKEFRLVAAVVFGFGGALALAMFGLMQYAYSQRPTAFPFLPGALLIGGLLVAAVGLVLFLSAVLGMAIRKRRRSN